MDRSQEPRARSQSVGERPAESKGQTGYRRVIAFNKAEYLLDYLVGVGILVEDDIARVQPLRREAAATLTGPIKALRKKAAAQREWNRNLISDEHMEYVIVDEH